MVQSLPSKHAHGWMNANLPSFLVSDNPSFANRPASSPARNSTSANSTPLQHSPQFGQSWETASVGLPVLIARAYSALPTPSREFFYGCLCPRGTINTNGKHLPGAEIPVLQ